MLVYPRVTCRNLFILGALQMLPRLSWLARLHSERLIWVLDAPKGCSCQTVDHHLTCWEGGKHIFACYPLVN